MSVLRKIAALTLCLAVMLGTLVACVEPNTGDDNAPLQSEKYFATVRVKYATNDPKMKAAVDAMGAPTTTVLTDGDSIKINGSVELDGVSVANEYVFIAGVLYHSSQITVGDKSLSVYEKAAMTEDDVDSLLRAAGPGANVTVGDFMASEMDISGDYASYVCSDMDSASAESLCDILSASFTGMGAIVRLESAEYSYDTYKGRVTNSVLSCNFIITMDGVDYEITMHQYYEYNYDAEVVINAPENSDSYTETAIEDIIG